MSFDTSHRLIKRISSSVLVIWTFEKMFMKYDERLLIRIFSTVQVPVMTGIPALNGNILIIHQYDIEVSGIDFLKTLSIKHRHLPF